MSMAPVDVGGSAREQKADGVQVRRVLVLVLPGAFSLDALGAFEIFQVAARLIASRGRPGPVDPTHAASFAGCPLAYKVELIGVEQGLVETCNGAHLATTSALAAVKGEVDTLVVAGGDVRRLMQAAMQPALLAELGRVAGLSRRVASVCTGAFLLAAAGLLDEKRATTHWAACEVLQKIFPKVRVEHDPIYTQDGKVYTSAGASTGMDLALSMVRDDHGRELAHEVARWLVLYVQRPGGQPQLSASLRGQEAERVPLRDLQAWIVENLGADLTVAALSAHVGMSVRNFARAFRRETKQTPAEFVEGVRVEAARRKLELGSASLEEVAREVGLGSVETLRRAFGRQLGVSPSEYRAKLAGVKNNVA
jgi:transcriptional regulator GlxA family with amidase domain